MMISSDVFSQLQLAGVRHLRFVNSRTAIDDRGRVIKFKRTVNRGYVEWSFEILPASQ